MYETNQSWRVPVYSLEAALLSGSTLVANVGDLVGDEWRRFDGASGSGYLLFRRSSSSPGMLLWAGIGSRTECAYSYYRGLYVTDDEFDESEEEAADRQVAEYRLLCTLLGRAPKLFVDKQGLVSHDTQELAAAALGWNSIRGEYLRADLPAALAFIAPLFPAWTEG